MCSTILGRQTLPPALPCRSQRGWPPRRRGGGRNGGLHVTAGLNYPHMPNKLRRQRQELKALPFAKPLIAGWRGLLYALDPQITWVERQAGRVQDAWHDQVDRYYDFCYEETKRRYRWEAHSKNELRFWKNFLTACLERGSVLTPLLVWEIVAPCALLWTFAVPLLFASTHLERDNPVWPLFWGLLLVMLPGKHPLGAPLRFL